MVQSSRRSSVVRKKNPAAIRNLVIGGVIGLLVLIMAAQYAGKAASRKSAAEKLLEQAKPVLASAGIVEDIKSNNDTLFKLGEARAKLEGIPRDLAGQYEKGLKLAAEIDAKCSEIRKKNMQLQTMKDKTDSLEKILAKLREGTMKPDKAAGLLDIIAQSVPGTDTGNRASAEAKKLRVDLGEKLAGDLKSEIEKIRALIKQEKFSKAADEIGRLMSMDDLPDPDGLIKKIDQELVDTAAAAFDKITMDIIDRSKSENKDNLKKELKQKYDEFGIRALKSRYDRTLSRLQ